MSDEFISRLTQFARTVDSISTDALFDVEGYFYDYMRSGLKACYFEVCIEKIPIDDEESGEFISSLETIWCSKSARRSQRARIKDEHETYFSQKAYVYEKGKPLWVVAKTENQLLNECVSLEDLSIKCSENAKPPPYKDYERPGEARTSILIPLYFQGLKFGVFDIEFDTVIPFGVAARNHIMELSRAISMIIGRHRTSKRCFDDTRSAFKDMRRQVDLQNVRLPGDLPSVFFAYSARADEAVVSAIKELLTGNFKGKIIVLDWEELDALGSITQQIVNVVQNSDFGIFYMSEKIENPVGGGKTYQDNPNVLFEAGMAHILKHNRSDTIRGWLPVREDADIAGKIPFDFAAERILVVPRSNDGGLKEARFKEKCLAHLNNALGL